MARILQRRGAARFHNILVIADICPRSIGLDIALKCRAFFFEKSTQSPIAI